MIGFRCSCGLHKHQTFSYIFSVEVFVSLYQGGHDSSLYMEHSVMESDYSYMFNCVSSASHILSFIVF